MKQRSDKSIDAFSTVMDEQQIKSIIKEKGWNQKEIAKFWGVSQNWITSLIKNRHGERGVRDDCAFRGLPQK